MKESFRKEVARKKNVDTLQLVFDIMFEVLKYAHDEADKTVSSSSARKKYLMNKKSTTKVQRAEIARKIKEADETCRKFCRMQSNIKHETEKWEKLHELYINRPTKYKHILLPMTKEIIVLLVPKNHDHPLSSNNKQDKGDEKNLDIISLADNVRHHMLPAFSGHYNRQIEVIEYSDDDKEFESEIKKLNKEKLSISKFILLGHGGKLNTVGACPKSDCNKPGINRLRLGEILDMQLRHFGIENCTLLATECDGFHHDKGTYTNLTVTALATKEYSKTIVFNNLHISLTFHLFKKYVQDYYL